MSTVLSTIATAFDNWNNASILSEAAAYMENASRLDWCRRFAERAIELDPKGSYEPYLTLCFAHMRDVNSTSEAGQNMISVGFQATGSMILRAWMAGMTEDENEFKQMLEEASQDKSFEACCAVANAYSWRGQVEVACSLIKDFPTRFEQGTQPDWAIYCGILIFAAERGTDVNLESDMLPHLQRLIAHRPDDLSYHALLLRYYSITKNIPDAISAAHAALNVSPDDETTMYTLAGLYEKSDNLDAAIHWCTRAIGAKSSYVAARVRLAVYLEKVDKKALADQVMLEIPTANPDYNFGKIRLAIYLYRNGNEENALYWFREAYPKLKEWELRGVKANEFAKEMLEKSGLQ